jgi:rSAM/selenodomain-associated transferase 1
MPPWQVAILARAAVPGEAKTRLIPRLGAARAATLQAQLTERAMQRVHAAGARIVLWIAGVADVATRELAQRFDAELRTQPPGDLGDRMHAAVLDAKAAGLPAMIIGTDCPAQQPEHLRKARMLLAEHDVVLQPALDGGYVMIAMNQPCSELFQGIAWGSEIVLESTRQRCAALGLTCAELPALSDLDRPEDLDLAIVNGWLDGSEWT